MIEDITITLAAGAELPASAYPVGYGLPSVPGVYLLLRKSLLGWAVLYVGEADDLDRRSGKGLKRHEKFGSASQLGMTHVAVLPLHLQNAHQRFDLERRLCADFKPPLNQQLVR